MVLHRQGIVEKIQSVHALYGFKQARRFQCARATFFEGEGVAWETKPPFRSSFNNATYDHSSTGVLHGAIKGTNEREENI